MTVKDRMFIGENEFDVMEKIVKKVLENISKIGMFQELLLKEIREDADG